MVTIGGVNSCCLSTLFFHLGLLRTPLGENKLALIWWLKSSRSEFRMVHSVYKDDHFKKGFAAAVYYSIVSQAIREVRAEFSVSFLVVVVCAGWHSEVGAITFMKEAFCAKQLDMCRTTMDLMRWAGGEFWSSDAF